MAQTSNCLLCSKSLLHRFVLSPLLRFCSTHTQCSKLVQTESLTASKDFHNVRTDSNPPKLSEIFKQHRYQLQTSSTDTSDSNPPKLFEIFKQHRYQLPTSRTDTSSRLDISFCLEKALNILKLESDPQKFVQIFKQSAKKPTFRSRLSLYEVTVKKLAFAKQFDAIEEILEHSVQRYSEEGRFVARVKGYHACGFLA